MIEAQVIDALKQVYDPCSVSAHAPVNVVDMGLITKVAVSEAGDVSIAVRPTSFGCTLMATIMQAVDKAASDVSGVASVSVSLDLHSPWSEAAMSSEGRHILDSRRKRSREEVNVEPRQWETRRAASRPDI